MSEDFPGGMVWLVGAGPGDPDLLTRKAERLIRAADVIFYDALVGPGVLALARPGTPMVSVGKRSGRHSKAQESINDLLLNAAREGKKVVRLKGGDPRSSGAVPRRWTIWPRAVCLVAFVPASPRPVRRRRVVWPR
jgi:uroporphyrin-III C-methyltransferase